MKSLKCILCTIIGLVFLSPVALSNDSSFFSSPNSGVSIKLVSNAFKNSMTAPTAVGVLFEIPEGWHIYWKNPGQTGKSTTVRWTQGKGIKLGKLYYPVPERFDENGFTTYGYSKRTLIFSQIKTIPAAPDIKIEANVEWLACKKICVPGKAVLSAPLNTIGGWRDLFERYLELVPHTIPKEILKDLKIKESKEGTEFHLPQKLPWCATKNRPPFIPLSNSDASVTWGKEADTLVVNIDEKVENGLLLQCTDNEEVKGFIWNKKSKNKNIAAKASTANIGLLYALLLAFIGGILLNLMPCVLPVLAIKTANLAGQAHEEPIRVRLHGMAYTAGILISMIILALAVILMKSAGRSVGWGFQFHHPLYVLFLIAVIFLFAFNMFGIFEITFAVNAPTSPAPQNTSLAGSLATGAAAVLLATPCTAPFLAVAVSFALSASNFTILAVFIAIGAGLALPFFLLSLIPSWTKALPKPGVWMIRLKKFLAMLLLITGVWLIYILKKQTSLRGVMYALFAIAIAALSSIVIRMIQRKEKSIKIWITSLAAVLAVFFILLHNYPLIILEKGAKGQHNTIIYGLKWQNFDPKKIEKTLDSKKPVFLAFTASWCLTCKANEKLVLHTQRASELFKEKGIVPFIADWSSKNPTVDKWLRKYGGTGVPRYILIDPKRPDSPIILPEVLTFSTLEKVFSKID